MIAGVANELDEAIDRFFPEAIRQAEPENHQSLPSVSKDFDTQACPIKAVHRGYLQIINDQLLLKLTDQSNLLLCLQAKPGEFIVKGKTLLLAYPGERLSPMLTAQINGAFLLGQEQTEQQEIKFPINQLVKIALCALSSRINDPFTAIRCIDRLSAGLVQLAQRPLPSAHRYDQTSKLRVVAEPVTFENSADSAFSQIRRYAVSIAPSYEHMLRCFCKVAIINYQKSSIVKA